MTTEDTERSEVEHKLRYLQGSPYERALALQGLSGTPLPDRRLLAVCEALLEDKTIALLGIPYCFGEIRWCAADAVASLRRVFNISEPVVIRDVFAPVSTAQAVRLAEAAGVTPRGEVEGVIEALETLAKMDRLPRRTITRTL
jgi:hypothetical protein